MELLRMYRELNRGYSEMVGDICQMVTAGAQMGVQHVDSHTLIAICEKHQKQMKDINGIFTDEEE
jgi:hypothetical protein